VEIFAVALLVVVDAVVAIGRLILEHGVKDRGQLVSSGGDLGLVEVEQLHGLLEFERVLLSIGRSLRTTALTASSANLRAP
jgi:hypothetical protein